jgi:hypothetical protein
MEHPSFNVQAAITRLLDELCEWERNTGRQSVLILREQGRFTLRAMSGKPVPESNNDVTDAQLVSLIEEPCPHERLDMDGFCMECGADKRGIG